MKKPGKAKAKAAPAAAKKVKKAPKLSAWDTQAAKVKRLTLAAKKANDNLRIATAELKAMPVGK